MSIPSAKRSTIVATDPKGESTKTRSKSIVEETDKTTSQTLISSHQGDPSFFNPQIMDELNRSELTKEGISSTSSKRPLNLTNEASMTKMRAFSADHLKNLVMKYAYLLAEVDKTKNRAMIAAESEALKNSLIRIIDKEEAANQKQESVKLGIKETQNLEKFTMLLDFQEEFSAKSNDEDQKSKDLEEVTALRAWIAGLVATADVVSRTRTSSIASVVSSKTQPVEEVTTVPAEKKDLNETTNLQKESTTINPKLTECERHVVDELSEPAHPNDIEKAGETKILESGTELQTTLQNIENTQKEEVKSSGTQALEIEESKEGCERADSKCKASQNGDISTGAESFQKQENPVQTEKRQSLSQAAPVQEERQRADSKSSGPQNRRVSGSMDPAQKQESTPVNQNSGGPSQTERRSSQVQSMPSNEGRERTDSRTKNSQSRRVSGSTDPVQKQESSTIDQNQEGPAQTEKRPSLTQTISLQVEREQVDSRSSAQQNRRASSGQEPNQKEENTSSINQKQIEEEKFEKLIENKRDSIEKIDFERDLNSFSETSSNEAAAFDEDEEEEIRESSRKNTNSQGNVQKTPENIPVPLVTKQGPSSVEPKKSSAESKKKKEMPQNQDQSEKLERSSRISKSSDKASSSAGPKLFQRKKPTKFELYTARVTPSSFEETFYQNNVKGFLEKKQEFLKKEKERKMMEEMSEVTFHPELSPSKYRAKIKEPFLERYKQYQLQSEAKLEKLRAEARQEKEINERKEVTFKPKINPQFVAQSIEGPRKITSTFRKEPSIMLSQQGDKVSPVRSRQQSTILSEDLLSHRPSINEVSEKLAENYIRETSTDVVERLLLLYMKAEEKKRLKYEQNLPKFSPVISPKTEELAQRKLLRGTHNPSTLNSLAHISAREELQDSISKRQLGTDRSSPIKSRSQSIVHGSGRGEESLRFLDPQHQKDDLNISEAQKKIHNHLLSLTDLSNDELAKLLQELREKLGGQTQGDGLSRREQENFSENLNIIEQNLTNLVHSIQEARAVQSQENLGSSRNSVNLAETGNVGQNAAGKERRPSNRQSRENSKKKSTPVKSKDHVRGPNSKSNSMGKSKPIKHLSADKQRASVYPYPDLFGEPYNASEEGKTGQEDGQKEHQIEEQRTLKRSSNMISAPTASSLGKSRRSVYPDKHLFQEESDEKKSSLTRQGHHQLHSVGKSDSKTLQKPKSKGSQSQTNSSSQPKAVSKKNKKRSSLSSQESGSAQFKRRDSNSLSPDESNEGQGSHRSNLLSGRKDSSAEREEQDMFNIREEEEDSNASIGNLKAGKTSNQRMKKSSSVNKGSRKPNSASAMSNKRELVCPDKNMFAERFSTTSSRNKQRESVYPDQQMFHEKGPKSSSKSKQRVSVYPDQLLFNESNSDSYRRKPESPRRETSEDSWRSKSKDSHRDSGRNVKKKTKNSQRESVYPDSEMFAEEGRKKNARGLQRGSVYPDSKMFSAEEQEEGDKFKDPRRESDKKRGKGSGDKKLKNFHRESVYPDSKLFGNSEPDEWTESKESQRESDRKPSKHSELEKFRGSEKKKEKNAQRASVYPDKGMFSEPMEKKNLKTGQRYSVYPDSNMFAEEGGEKKKRKDIQRGSVYPDSKMFGEEEHEERRYSNHQDDISKRLKLLGEDIEEVDEITESQESQRDSESRSQSKESDRKRSNKREDKKKSKSSQKESDYLNTEKSKKKTSQSGQRVSVYPDSQMFAEEGRKKKARGLQRGSVYPDSKMFGDEEHEERRNSKGSQANNKQGEIEEGDKRTESKDSDKTKQSKDLEKKKSPGSESRKTNISQRESNKGMSNESVKKMPKNDQRKSVYPDSKMFAEQDRYRESIGSASEIISEEDSDERVDLKESQASRDRKNRKDQQKYESKDPRRGSVSSDDKTFANEEGSARKESKESQKGSDKGKHRELEHKNSVSESRAKGTSDKKDRKKTQRESVYPGKMFSDEEMDERLESKESIRESERKLIKGSENKKSSGSQKEEVKKRRISHGNAVSSDEQLSADVDSKQSKDSGPRGSVGKQGLTKKAGSINKKKKGKEIKHLSQKEEDEEMSVSSKRRETTESNREISQSSHQNLTDRLESDGAKRIPSEKDEKHFSQEKNRTPEKPDEKKSPKGLKGGEEEGDREEYQHANLKKEDIQDPQIKSEEKNNRKGRKKLSYHNKKSTSKKNPTNLKRFMSQERESDSSKEVGSEELKHELLSDDLQQQERTSEAGELQETSSRRSTQREPSQVTRVHQDSSQSEKRQKEQAPQKRSKSSSLYSQERDSKNREPRIEEKNEGDNLSSSSDASKKVRQREEKVKMSERPDSNHSDNEKLREREPTKKELQEQLQKLLKEKESKRAKIGIDFAEGVCYSPQEIRAQQRKQTWAGGDITPMPTAELFKIQLFNKELRNAPQEQQTLQQLSKSTRNRYSHFSELIKELESPRETAELNRRKTLAVTSYQHHSTSNSSSPQVTSGEEEVEKVEKEPKEKRPPTKHASLIMKSKAIIGLMHRSGKNEIKKK